MGETVQVRQLSEGGVTTGYTGRVSLVMSKSAQSPAHRKRGLWLVSIEELFLWNHTAYSESIQTSYVIMLYLV